MGKRILILISVAVALFISGILLLGGIIAALYYDKINVFDNPIVASWLQLNPENQGTRHPTSAGTLTDSGNYQTENNWLASTTAEEIAGMAWLAIHPNVPAPPFQIKAIVDPRKSLVHLEIKGWTPDQTITADLTPAYAWDSEGYAPLVRQLIGNQKAVDPGGTDASDILDDLLTPTGKVLATKDVDLSHQLLQTPASAALHDKAALLLLTLAWREHAGLFSDPRLLLCRAAAHLALAQALRGDGQPDWPGKIADATLRTLSGREADALQHLDLLTQQTDSSDSAKMWIRILKLWNKMDWRGESPDGRSPLLMKMVWFNTITASQWDSQAFTKLDVITPLDQVPDWGRILFSVNDVASVDVGHRFCQSTVVLEFAELKEILAAENEPLDASASMAKVFNDPIHPTVFPTSSGENGVHIIGAAVFKDTALRHLFSAIRQTHGWLRESWGVPDQDAKFVSRMERLFQGVPHERFLSLMLELGKFDVRPESAGLQTDVADIPPALAFWIKWHAANCDRLVSYYSWGIPFNAPYSMDVRSGVLSAIQPGSSHIPANEPPPPSFSDLRPLAPNSYEIASWVIVDKLAHGQHMTKDQEEALLLPFFDYSVYALNYFKGLADHQTDFDDATLELILRKECALAPDDYFDLGDFLRQRGRLDEAAEADRKGAAEAPNRVLVSNCIQPLVEYDYAHGQGGEAMQLALDARDVYSHGGIATYVWLLCKLNRFDEAEQWAQKQEDRYKKNSLSFFYVEHRDHFPDKYKAIEQEYFPNGLTHVTRASFTSPPKAGCAFTGSSDKLKNAGLRQGDVVVALDSYPVTSEDIYQFIRSLSDGPAMDLIIWRGGKYQEIKASVPGRKFAVDLQNYPSP